ncbi:MAG: hypothetical protein ACT4P7_24110 [Gemmatimonadaceae bacterium]
MSASLRAGARALTRVALVLATAGAAACIDITVDSSALGSLEFVPLPYPSIDAGDTLRDANGVAVKLQANVFLADGSLDTKRPVTFLSLDSSVTISSANFLVAKPFKAGTVTDSARLVATVGSLQSQQRRLTVVPRPDSLARGVTVERDTIFYSAPAAATDTSMALLVRVLSKSGTPPVGVPFYIVRYRLFNAANQQVPATDTTLAFFLVDDLGRVAAADTSDVSGNASRRVRFRIRQGQAPIDSIRVLAQVRRGSRIVPGDSITWVVRVQPKG